MHIQLKENNLEKILVVDDQEDNVELLHLLLTQQGYRVITAYDGKTAIALAQATQPDLILLDVMMPEMTGYEICLKLREQSSTDKIPVIFISGLEETMDKVKAFQSGGVDYITKPFDIEEVIARIENQLGIQRLTKQLKIQNDRLADEIKRRKVIEIKLQQANAKLLSLATLDGLTGVANRRRFDQYLEQEWRRAAREQQYLSLILCDVDYFKLYNDTYGHQAGDKCLKQIAQVLKSVLKRSLDLAARYGGEEFAVILPNTNISGTCYVAKMIQLQVQQCQIPHEKSKTSDRVSVSLGVASMIPSPHITSASLVAAADAALYQAKQQGRDRVVAYQPEL